MNKPVFPPPSPARRATESRIDDELAQSFPASDPPSWTLGAAEPGDSERRIQGNPHDTAALP